MPHTETKQRIESRSLVTFKLKTDKIQLYCSNSASEIKVYTYHFLQTALAVLMLIRRYIEAFHDADVYCDADARRETLL